MSTTAFRATAAAGGEVDGRPYLFWLFRLRIELMYAKLSVMFEALDETIAGTDVPPSGLALERIHRLRDQFDARATEAEVSYARDGGHELDGFATMAGFLGERCRLPPAEARAGSRRAARLARWPEVLDAWLAGSVSGARVELIVREVPERHVARFAQAAAEVCDILAPLSHRHAREALQHWVGCADAVVEREAAEAGTEAPPVEVDRELWVSGTTGGVAVVKGELDQDTAAVTLHALRLAQRADLEGEHRTPAQRRADALGVISRFYLDHHTEVTSTRRQERLVVTCEIVGLYGCALRGAGVRTAEQLDEFLAARPWLGALERGLFLEAFDGHDDVARTLDGNPISDGLLSTISEGGLLERLLTVGSRVVDHGRSLRHHSASQWRALAVRDGGCRFPGCDDGPDGTHAHHTVRWEWGGPTDLDTGVLLSPHCHTVVSRPGWSDRVEPDGTYVVTTPSGQELRSSPPGLVPDRRLPVPTTAEAARPLPFDPAPTREPDPPARAQPELEPASPAPDPGETVRLVDRLLERLATSRGDTDRRPLVDVPRRPQVDALLDGLVVSLS
jgi:hypothetical protein